MPETIGQRLKKAREYRNLTLEKVEEATHIRLQFLKALEADDFSSMPSPVQARGFLRNYAQYLGLDLDQIVEELRETPVEPESEEEIVVFENEYIEQQSLEDEQPYSESDDDSSFEPFWQTWLRRVRQESGQEIEENASKLEPQTAPVIDVESSPETDADQEGDDEADEKISEVDLKTKFWESFLNRVNIRISKQKEEEPSQEAFEETPDAETKTDVPKERELSSHDIINDIGLKLRQRREMLSLSLDEIERHTRMRGQFLEALERGNFDDLPSPMQTRGMLSNYAKFLDLDVDEILLQFAEALQAQHRERHPEGAVRKRGATNVPENIPTLRSFIAGDMVFGYGVIIILVVFSVWGISRVISLQSTREPEVQVEATGPSIAEALIGTPIETVESEVTLIAAEDTPLPDLPEGTVEIPTPDFAVNVQLNLVAVERTFLRVIVDGEEEYNGRTIPGNAYSFEAEQNIEILAGNGEALRVIYNQNDLGLLGGFGQVSHYVYTVDDVFVPTPEIPPTPTNTPFVSPTPSNTPTPTATPIPEDE